MSAQSRKNPARKKPKQPPDHPKHGQDALIENVLEIVDANLEDLPEPGAKQSDQPRLSGETSEIIRREGTEDD